MKQNFQKTTMWLLVLFSAYSGWAQVNNAVFEMSDPIDSAEVNQLNFKIYSAGFTKNNEYFNRIADGYTLFGSQFYPRLAYTVNPVFKIEAGIYIQDDWGNKGLETVVPVITLKARYLGVDINMGAIEGGADHRLIEPMFEFERILVDRIEQGLQFRLDKPGVFADLWVEWETMIYPGDSLQEEVYGGFSYEKKLGNSGFSIPVQLVVYHQGGQIDRDPSPLKTLTNLSLGVKRKDEFSGRINEVENSVYFLGYKDFSFTRLLTYEQGNGFYANSMVGFRGGLKLMLSYWSGHDFIGLLGGKLYPSVSSTFKYPNFTRPDHNLLILRILHDIPLGKGVYLTTRIEPFYDFEKKAVDFSHGFYLQYRDLFKIWEKE